MSASVRLLCVALCLVGSLMVVAVLAKAQQPMTPPPEPSPYYGDPPVSEGYKACNIMANCTTKQDQTTTCTLSSGTIMQCGTTTDTSSC